MSITYVLEERDKMPTGSALEEKTATRKPLVNPDKLNVGIIGCGQLGRGLLSELRKYSWAERHVYSRHNSEEDYVSLRTLDGEIPEREPIYHPDAKGVLENSDIVVVTTGAPPGTIDYAAYMQVGRNGDLEEKMLKENATRVIPILEDIKRINYQGAIIMLSNPEMFMDIARNFVFGRNPSKIFSVPNDSVRLKKIVKLDIERNHSIQIDYNSLYIPIGGPHSMPIPFWGEGFYNKKPLAETFPEYADPEKQAKITAELRSLPLRIMSASQKMKVPYQGTQIQIVKTLADIFRNLSSKREESIHCRCYTDYSLETFIPEFGTFMDWPATISIEKPINCTFTSASGQNLFSTQRPFEIEVFPSLYSRFYPQINGRDLEILCTEAERRKKMIERCLNGN